jgi:hypothetical protein
MAGGPIGDPMRTRALRYGVVGAAAVLVICLGLGGLAAGGLLAPQPPQPAPSAAVAQPSGTVAHSTPSPAAVQSSAPASPSATPASSWTSVTRTKPILGGEIFGGDGNQYIMAATAYGNGFVAVGEDCCGKVDTVTGTVWTTPDGRSWTRIEPKDVFGEAEIDQVAASGNRLVAVGTSRANSQAPSPETLVWVSDDGLTWRRADPAGQAFTAAFRPAGIAGGPSGFVAWGQSASGEPHVAVSVDGETWTDAGFAGAYPATIVDGVSPWRGGWVALGSQAVKQPAGVGASTPGPARAWYSADGVLWSAASVDGFALGRPLAGSGGLLAFGATSACGACIGPATLWRSDDGRSWQSIGKDLLTNRSYAADGARMARLTMDVNAPADKDESLEVSLDGIDWTTLAMGLPGEQHLGLAVGVNGILLLEPTYKSGATDQADAGVWYLPAQ